MGGVYVWQMYISNGIHFENLAIFMYLKIENKTNVIEFLYLPSIDKTIIISFCYFDLEAKLTIITKTFQVASSFKLDNLNFAISLGSNTYLLLVLLTSKLF